MTNQTLSERLRQYAEELARQGGNLFRVRAFRSAAFEIARMGRPLEDVLAESGRAGLEAIPAIGQSLAYTIEGLLKSGDLRTLRPDDEPQRLLLTLPGVGIRLAEALRDRLGITTLEQLREAARAGRLAEVGVGPKRLAGILAAVEQRLAREECPAAPVAEPSVADLLAVDSEYREGMEGKQLPLLVPRNFNPEGERWLGVLRSERDGWRMRALFSNTALAHRLEKTRDWVVIYFERGETRGQRTVVTETRGELAGMRVVRGREAECRRHYHSPAAA
jgi:hypothetical protein